MNPEDRALFEVLGSVNLRLSAFGFALLEEAPISAQDQLSLAHRLVDVAEAIRARVERLGGSGNPGGVVEGQVAHDSRHQSKVDEGPRELT